MSINGQMYVHIKTGRRYIVLAQGVDCTNTRDGIAVTIYHTVDCQHTIFVRETEEFDIKFLATV